MNELYLVRQMHEKFLIGRDDSWKNLLFRIGAMQEELVEFTQASLKRNRVDQLDALIDLAVFLFGTVDQLGFTEEQWNEGFSKVMASNMGKELATRDGSNSKRGHGTDLVKPAGWKPANLEEVVHGKSREQLDRSEFKELLDDLLASMLTSHEQCEVPISEYNVLIGKEDYRTPDGTRVIYWDSALESWLRKNYGSKVIVVTSKTHNVTRRTIIVNPQ